MSRFLQFWCPLNKRGNAETCQFRFLRDYYDDSLDVMSAHLPNHFPPFPMVFPHVSLAFLQFPRVLLPFPLSVSLVSFLGFAIHSIANNLYLKGTHSTATNLCTVFHLIIYFANRYNPSLFTFDKKINKTDRKEEK